MSGTWSFVFLSAKPVFLPSGLPTRRHFSSRRPWYDLRRWMRDQMALFDDILSGGNWVTGLAIGVGAVVILPLAVPILRPLAKTAIKGGILAYQGAAGLVEGIGDIVAEVATEVGGEIAAPAVEGAVQDTGTARPRRGRD
jgi:hypothetical protein